MVALKVFLREYASHLAEVVIILIVVKSWRD